MTTSEQMRRLERLEAAARMQDLNASLERDLDALQTRLAEIAAELGCTVDAFREEVIAGFRRREEIGESAYERELAAQLGGTVEDLRSGELVRRIEHEWAEWKEEDQARRAQVISWRGSQMHRGGQPVHGMGSLSDDRGQTV